MKKSIILCALLTTTLACAQPAVERIAGSKPFQTLVTNFSEARLDKFILDVLKSTLRINQLHVQLQKPDIFAKIGAGAELVTLVPVLIIYKDQAYAHVVFARRTVAQLLPIVADNPELTHLLKAMDARLKKIQTNLERLFAPLDIPAIVKKLSAIFSDGKAVLVMIQRNPTFATLYQAVIWDERMARTKQALDKERPRIIAQLKGQRGGLFGKFFA